MYWLPDPISRHVDHVTHYMLSLKVVENFRFSSSLTDNKVRCT